MTFRGVSTWSRKPIVMLSVCEIKTLKEAIVEMRHENSTERSQPEKSAASLHHFYCVVLSVAMTGDLCMLLPALPMK